MSRRNEVLRNIFLFLVASVLVGFLLDVLAITPLDLWRGIWARIESAARLIWTHGGRVLRWFAIGAAVVGPILLLRLLVLRLRRG